MPLKHMTLGALGKVKEERWVSQPGPVLLSEQAPIYCEGIQPLSLTYGKAPTV